MISTVSTNLFNELWKRDQMRGWLISVSLFRNEFNQVANSIHVKHEQYILDCIYHMAIKYFEIAFLAKTNGK